MDINNIKNECVKKLNKIRENEISPKRISEELHKLFNGKTVAIDVSESNIDLTDNIQRYSIFEPFEYGNESVQIQFKYLISGKEYNISIFSPMYGIDENV